MNKRCCFAGHSKVYDDYYEKLKQSIESLILNKGVTEFWVGHYGHFDCSAASAVYELKAIYPNIKLVLLLPYTTKAIDTLKDYYYKKYDELVMADIPYNTPSRYRIIKCNQYMINHCDFLLCYVKFPWGGAYTTLNFAQNKKHIRVINLAD